LPSLPFGAEGGDGWLQREVFATGAANDLIRIEGYCYYKGATEDVRNVNPHVS
jgi:hypothetical protein